VWTDLELDEQVSASGDKLISYQGELDGIVTAIDQAVRAIKQNWGGADAEAFESAWGSKRVLASTAAERLGEMGQRCKANAQAQTSASGA
jgi:uncharacterized protein YukE